jgi:hypothetical protein
MCIKPHVKWKTKDRRHDKFEYWFGTIQELKKLLKQNKIITRNEDLVLKNIELLVVLDCPEQCNMNLVLM